MTIRSAPAFALATTFVAGVAFAHPAPQRDVRAIAEQARTGTYTLARDAHDHDRGDHGDRGHDHDRGGDHDG
jgi:hypothetical protein